MNIPYIRETSNEKNEYNICFFVLNAEKGAYNRVDDAARVFEINSSFLPVSHFRYFYAFLISSTFWLNHSMLPNTAGTFYISHSVAIYLFTMIIIPSFKESKYSLGTHSQWDFICTYKMYL